MTDDIIGVDISKAHFDVYRTIDGALKQFPNNAAGFSSFRDWLGDMVVGKVVYEPTGCYHKPFEHAFSDQFPLVKVNPLQARRFAQATGTRVKSDPTDARLLAAMGASLGLEPDQPVCKKKSELRELKVARNALIKDRTRLKNRLQTQTVGLLRIQTRARLTQIKHQLDALDREIDQRLDQDRQTARAGEILRSIPGIGAVASATIRIEMPEIGTLRKKQAASLAGLAPVTRQSGQWRGKAFIQGGRKCLRNALYMPALVAVRYNPDLKQQYRTMISKGKPPKLALTAIMRKLIELANTLIKNDRFWVKNYA